MVGEILPRRNSRIQVNQAYSIVILMARVITRPGTLPEMIARLIEDLDVAALAYLQDVYDRINPVADGGPKVPR